MYSAQGQPEVNNGCPLPPYNTLNFTSANPTIYQTLQTIARTSPNYPLPPNADASQIADNRANVSYFNTLNQQTIAIRSLNQTLGSASRIPYPQFKSEADRLKYRQGLASVAARTQFTGQNPAAPAGVPCSTIYQIINQ